MSRKLIIVTCPKCGREYLPAEVFIPSAFFGHPELIKRDAEGKIVDVIGTSIDAQESYCCDSCGCAFVVSTDISFSTEVDVKNDFNSDYVSTLKPRFNLKEF